MASKFISILPLPGDEDGLNQELKEFISSLPVENRWQFHPLRLYQDIWYLEFLLPGTLACQSHFQAKDSDLILATAPKSGTTWLKALTFAIIHRTHGPRSLDPLLTNNPHELVPHFESDLYVNNQNPNPDDFRPPSLFGTHIPYNSLPESILNSNCKVVFICRNPRDTFISHWHFANKLTHTAQTPVPLEEAFDLYCTGTSWGGPFWEHMLGYWKASLERPEKVLFLKYEDLKMEPLVQLKRLAEFMGYPFTDKDEIEGTPEDILRLCSFENLSSLEINKTGKLSCGVDHTLFFRKGEVGDSSAYLTPGMIERLDQLTEKMLQGSGLVFEVSGA